MKKSGYHSIRISEKIYNEIKEYCILNGIKFIDFVNNLLENALRKEKYGEVPSIFSNESNNEEHRENLLENKNDDVEITKKAQENTNIVSEEIRIENDPISIESVITQKEDINNKIAKPTKRRLK